MLSKCFSYYNYKLYKTLTFQYFFLKKVCRNNPSGTLVKYAIPFFSILQWSLPPCRLRGQLQILGNQQRSRPDAPQMQRLHGRMRQQL